MSETTPPTNSLGVTPEAPWLGLRSFTEEVRDYFFGRDREIQELFERVQHRTLTVMYGQSGWGKTSLLRAGLIPKLRDAGFFPYLIRLDFLDGSREKFVGEEGTTSISFPSINKDESLETQVVSEFLKAVTAVESGVDANPERPPSLWELFHDPNWKMTEAHTTPVLIFDQFEELFIKGEKHQPEDARAFFEGLACLVENRPPAKIRERLDNDDDFADRISTSPVKCRVLITLRDDFLHRLERERQRMPSMMDNRFELRPLSGPQALTAVHCPGEKRGGPLGPIVSRETAEAIVRVVAGEPPEKELEEVDNVPPILSLICEQLNARRLDRAEPTITAEGLSKTTEVLRDFYESCLREHPPQVRHFVEDELVNESGRESRRVGAAKQWLADHGVLDAGERLNRLVAQRLLVIEQRGDVERVELTHDILAPIATTARKERKSREETDRTQDQLAVEKRNRRWMLMVAAVMSTLLGCSLVLGLHAFRSAQTATQAKEKMEYALNKSRDDQIQVQKERDRAELLRQKADDAKATVEVALVQAREQRLRADAAVARNREFLDRASMIDMAAGRRVLDEIDSAERGRVLPIGFEGRWKWREALASFALAMELASDKGPPAELVFETIRSHARAWAGLPRRRIPHDRETSDAMFNHDGTQMLTVSGDKTVRLWTLSNEPSVLHEWPHKSNVQFACFSPDFELVITGEADGAIHVWNAAAGTPQREPVNHGRSVNHAEFSSDGDRVVSTGADKTVRIWSPRDPQIELRIIPHSIDLNAACFSPDGSRILVVGNDKSCLLWSLLATDERLVCELTRRSLVHSAAFSPDGKQIVTTHSDSTAVIWDANSGEVSHELTTGSGSVVSGQFSPDGWRLVTLTNDGIVQQWDAGTGRRIGELSMKHPDVLYGTYSPDGRLFATVGRDRTCRVWNLDQCVALGEPLHHPSPVVRSRFNGLGTELATACHDGHVRIWPVRPYSSDSVPLRHPKRVTHAMFDSVGGRVITAGLDGEARLWDATSGIRFGKPMNHETSIRTVCVSPDSKLVATLARNSKYCELWDVSTGESTGVRCEHEDVVTSVCFGKGGELVLTTSDDGTAKCWSSKSGAAIGKPMQHDAAVELGCFAPTGTRVVTTTSAYVAHLHDASSGHAIGQPMRHSARIVDIGFSPDGKWILTASTDKTARIWSAQDGSPQGTELAQHSPLRCIRANRDSNLLATADSGGNVRIWTPFTDPQEVSTAMRHRQDVVCVRFSSDGKRLYTASYDHTARVWESPSGRSSLPVFRHDNWVGSVDVSHDDTRVLTASYDNTARIWDVLSNRDRESLAQASDRVMDWARAVSGMRHRDDGTLELIAETESLERLRAPDLPNGPWLDLARWLTGTDSTRPVSWRSRLTVRQVAEREFDFAAREFVETDGWTRINHDEISRDALESALQYDPTVPLARMMLGNVLERLESAKAEDEREPGVYARAAHWRRYDLDRLPDDPALRKRAAGILRELPDAKVGVGPKPTLARDEADKLDPPAKP